ncbi:YkvA family protein [Priestia sp. YIM B13446]|uniref:YkvA family protein n=1 Tax=Priestia TaxID=2800373 RepID=UPI00048D1945|nr:YkvA family protein [Priestia megaterium]MCU7739632.1 YkvA family protein [Priestia megaterium]MCU7745014.1 YkvA family protein [Priestia megaterium]
MLNQLKLWAKKLKKQLFILYLAYKDERVSWYIKLFTACVVAYAFSPIDLIPDFIPVLGYIDDIIIVPLGIMLALKMLPTSVIEDCTIKAEELIGNERPKNWVAGSIIIVVWLLIFMWSCFTIFKLLN